MLSLRLVKCALCIKMCIMNAPLVSAHQKHYTPEISKALTDPAVIKKHTMPRLTNLVQMTLSKCSDIWHILRWICIFPSIYSIFIFFYFFCPTCYETVKRYSHENSEEQHSDSDLQRQLAHAFPSVRRRHLHDLLAFFFLFFQQMQMWSNCLKVICAPLPSFIALASQ